MNDSDPRPMPPQVLAAYRDPLNLAELLASKAFTDWERLAVRDELLERIVSKHGNVEVETEKNAEPVPIRQHVAQLKKDAWNGIEAMISAEEFGGRDVVLFELAGVMQRYWLRWWEEMDWIDYESMHDSVDIAANVLGNRQLAWLAAQFSRSAVDIVSDSLRGVAVRAISSAEAWAVLPSKENMVIAGRIGRSAYNRVPYAAYTAYVAVSSDAARPAKDAADSVAAYVAAYVGPSAPAVISRLCELTKRLITPTLITHASRGLR